MRLSQIAMITLAVFFLPSPLLADDIPMTISYQGKLTDVNGEPVNDDVSMGFRIYDGEGTPIWPEAGPEIHIVTVSQGLYTVEIGSESDGIDLPFDQAYWLEVSINGGTMSPRQEITAVGYARSLAPGANIPGDFFVDGNVGIGTTELGTDPDIKLDVHGGGIMVSSDGDPYDVPKIILKDEADYFSLLMFYDSEGGLKTNIVATGSNYPPHAENRFIIHNFDSGDNPGPIHIYSAGNYGISYTAGITILNGGNVGIKTTTPQGALHVSYGHQIVTTETACTDFGAEYDGWFDTNSSQTVNGNDVCYIHDGFVVDSTTGNVGIGTADPQRPLHIARSGFTTMILEQTDGSVDAKKKTIGVSSGKLRLGTLSDDMTTSENHMVIDNGGNVGIGTEFPLHKLDVEGTVQAFEHITGDIYFQKDGKKLWRMFEDEEGLYVEKLSNGETFNLHAMKNQIREQQDLILSLVEKVRKIEERLN